MSELAGKLVKSQKNFMKSLGTGFTPHQMLLKLFMDVMQEPIQDFSGLLLNPFIEQFTQISAPLIESLEGIMNNLSTFVINILVVIWPSITFIIEKAGDFLDTLSDLLDLVM